MSVYCLSPLSLPTQCLALLSSAPSPRSRSPPPSTFTDSGGGEISTPPSISDVEEDVEALFQKFYLRGTTPFSRRSREEKSQDARRCYRAALLERCRSAGQRLCQARTVGWRVAAYSPPASTSRRAIVRARERGAMTQQLIKDWAKGGKEQMCASPPRPEALAPSLSRKTNLCVALGAAVLQRCATRPLSRRQLPVRLAPQLSTTASSAASAAPPAPAAI